MTTVASQITSLTVVYSIVYSDAYQRKHQSSASLAFVWVIHREPVNSPHKGPVTRKMAHLMTSSWIPYPATILCEPESHMRPTSLAVYEFTHDDVIKWKHVPRYWPFVRGIHRSPVNYPHKGQWRGALKFSLICVWINGWVNNGEAGDLRGYPAHYDVTVMNPNFK